MHRAVSSIAALSAVLRGVRLWSNANNDAVLRLVVPQGRHQCLCITYTISVRSQKAGYGQKTLTTMGPA